MKIEELRRALERSGIKQSLSGYPDAKTDLSALYELLTEYADLSVGEFCMKARKGLGNQHKTGKAPPAEIRPTENPVAMYLEELDRTKRDSRQFEIIVSRMQADKRVRKGEALEIAARFVGSKQKITSKKDAFKAILQRQIGDIRTAEKLGSIADIF